MDPCAGFLAEFGLKFPKHSTVQKAFGIEDLEGVDLVVSLSGHMSYVAPNLVFRLVSSGVNYFLMFYKQGYRPTTSANFEHYFSHFNLPSEDFGSFAIVTNLRMPCGSLAFPRLTRSKGARESSLLNHPQNDQSVKLKMEKGVSLGGTVLTMLNSYLGSGILVLPYGWQLAGWMFAVPFLGIALMMGFTLWVTGFLLKVVDVRAVEMGVPQLNRDWGMLGRMAFGPAGGLFFSTCVFIDLYGGIISGLIIVRSQMAELLPIPGVALGGIIYVLFFLLLFIDSRHFSSIAALGLISMLLVVTSLLVTGGELGAREIAEDQEVLKWEGIPPAAGVGWSISHFKTPGMAIYTFMVHSEAPLVYQLMEDRSEWTTAVLLSTTGACLGFDFVGLAKRFPAVEERLLPWCVPHVLQLLWE